MHGSGGRVRERKRARPAALLIKEAEFKAAEMLRELDDRPSLDTLIRESTAEIPDDELDAWTDSVLAALVLARGDDEIRSRWPETARVLDERAWRQRR